MISIKDCEVLIILVGVVICCLNWYVCIKYLSFLTCVLSSTESRLQLRSPVMSYLCFPARLCARIFQRNQIARSGARYQKLTRNGFVLGSFMSIQIASGFSGIKSFEIATPPPFWFLSRLKISCPGILAVSISIELFSLVSLMQKNQRVSLSNVF